MLLLLFTAPFVWEPIDKSTIGHLSVGYVSTDVIKVLCKDDSQWRQNTNALLVTFIVGYGVEMLSKEQSATDLFATLTGGVCKIVFDHFFNKRKPKEISIKLSDEEIVMRHWVKLRELAEENLTEAK